MFNYTISTILDYFFASRGLNPQIQDHVEDEGLEKAGFILQGNRPHAELEAVKAPDGRVLMRRSWSPPEGTETIGLVYICHGFTEHMANYNGLGETLSEAGFHCFGTDLVGHGLSDTIDGLKAYIPDFKACRQDILTHIQSEQLKHINKRLKTFCVAHSMGGMLSLRLALDNPNLFSGIILVGPLIHFGSSDLLSSFPTSSIFPSVNGAFQWIMKGYLSSKLNTIQIGTTQIDNVTSDVYMQRLLKRDGLRHFGGAYVGMITQFGNEMVNNLRDMADKMTTPFLVLFGEKDPLCNISGGWELYLTSHRVRKADKAMIVMNNARHQLYMEIPPVREKAINETLSFLLART